MKPILFPSNATQFNTNGIGRLDAISCTVTEERNGAFELEMLISEVANHASDIEMSSIIVAKVPDKANLQAFRVYKITKPIDGKFKVLAQHISYQLSYVPVMPFEVLASAGACAETFVKLKANAAENCPFNFSTDVTTVASFKINAPISLRSSLGGVEGSVLDKFGGEYSWDNYNVSFLKHRGVTIPNVSLRYGKNITDISQEKYISNTYTGICPYWKDSEGNNLVTLPEKVIHSQYAPNFPFQRTLTIDMSADFQEQPTVAQLRAAATAYLNTTGVGIPTVSIKLSFVSLADTEEYKQIAALQSVKLCDIVAVQFEKLGIDTTAKVVKYTYDVLLERYDSVEIGSLRTSLASTISNTNGAISALQSAMTTKFGQMGNDLRNEIDNATAWLTSSGGYVIAVKNNDGSWKELLFMSTNDVTDPHANVLRINENGLGFSSTGVAGPYTQAWTLDGRMVIGGTNVPSLTVYDNQQNILFRINKDGLQWSAANSSMDVNGNLDIKNGTFTGGTIQTAANGARIVLHKDSNDNPELILYDSQGNVLFEADENGVNVNGGTITGATIQTSTQNARIVMDNTSTLKGLEGNTLYNLINLIQTVSGTHRMVVDAAERIDIRTPKIWVANESGGTGSVTVYETRNDDDITVVTGVKKDTEDCVELWLKGVAPEDGDVLCILPVFLEVEKTTFGAKHGMWLTGETTSSEVI